MSQRGFTDQPTTYPTAFIQVWSTAWIQQEILNFLGLTDVRSFYLYMMARDYYYMNPQISAMAHDYREIYIYRVQLIDELDHAVDRGDRPADVIQELQQRIAAQGIDRNFWIVPGEENQDEEERVATQEAREDEYYREMAADFWATRSVDSDGHMRDHSPGERTPPSPWYPSPGSFPPSSPPPSPASSLPPLWRW